MAASHAIQRAQQRMGLKVSLRDMLILRRKINARREATYVGPANGTTQRWTVNYRRRIWYVIFDPSTNRICTVLDEKRYLE